VKRLLFAVCLLLLTPGARADDARSIRGLSQAVAKLSPNVDPAEAQLLSATAHHTARELAGRYRIVGSPEFQNFLIHIGVRQRGYCYQWAQDIGSRLKELHLRTLDLHWGTAEAGSPGEHNCLVVTAHSQPFATGYLIDGWRYAGRLFWWPVIKDNYLWQESPNDTRWLQSLDPRLEQQARYR
jgi:hypothetical protein